MSRPSLVHGLASVSPSRTGDRALEPPPASASIQVSQSSSSAFISTQSLGKRPPPPYPRGQPWAWGAPLLLDRAVNKSTPWLPATLHGPLSNAGIGVVFNRHSHESLIAGFQLLKEPLFVLVLVFLLTNQTASGPSSSVAPDGGDGRRQGRRRKGRPDSDSSRAGEPSPEAPWLQRPMAGSPCVCVCVCVCVFSFFVLLLKPQFSLQNGQTMILASVSPRFSQRGSLHFDDAGVSGNSGSPTLLPQVSF